MTIKEKIEKSITLTIISFSLASFLAGIATYKGIIEIADLSVIAKVEHKSNIKEIETLRRKLEKSNEVVKNISESVIVGKEDDSGRVYFIATGWSELPKKDSSQSSQYRMHWQRARMNAQVRLVEVIYGIQLSHKFGQAGSETSAVSSGMLSNVREIERNIINDSIAEIKLKAFLDEQNSN